MLMSSNPLLQLEASEEYCCKKEPQILQITLPPFRESQKGNLENFQPGEIVRNFKCRSERNVVFRISVLFGHTVPGNPISYCRAHTILLVQGSSELTQCIRAALHLRVHFQGMPLSMPVCRSLSNNLRAERAPVHLPGSI
jgi:hypothetical protein